MILVQVSVGKLLEGDISALGQGALTGSCELHPPMDTLFVGL